MICPVCKREATQLSNTCYIGANHYRCSNGHEMCGFEQFWRKDGACYCGLCGQEMEFLKGPDHYGWACQNKDCKEYRE